MKHTTRLADLSWTEALSERRFGLLAPLPVVVPWSEPTVGITRHHDWKPTEVQDAFLKSLRRNADAIAGRP